MLIPRFARVMHAAILCGLVLSGGYEKSRAAEFIPLGFLPGLDASDARAVSDDGLVVAGEAELDGTNNDQAFRWTDSTGMLGIGTLPGFENSNVRRATSMSADGSVIVGTASTIGTPSIPSIESTFIYRQGQGLQSPDLQHTRALMVSSGGDVVVGALDRINDFNTAPFRWTLANGEVQILRELLDDLDPNRAGFAVEPYGMSPNADVIVGETRLGAERPRETFIWTEENRFQTFVPDGLKPAAPGEFLDYRLIAVSGDGSVVAGEGEFLDGSVSVFLWSESTGSTKVGRPGTSFRDMTDDASVVLFDRLADGSDAGHSQIWSAQFGDEDLGQALVDRHGLTGEIEAWPILSANAISGNGQFIVGVGLNPSGQQEGWLVRLDRPLGAPVPEPSAAVMLMLASLCCAGIGRRR